MCVRHLTDSESSWLTTRGYVLGPSRLSTNSSGIRELSAYYQIAMKEFSCGDVVPGCTAAFRAETEPALLEQVARHARDDHGLTELPPELVAKVKARIRTPPGHA